jgi:hypothetical protein
MRVSGRRHTNERPTIWRNNCARKINKILQFAFFNNTQNALNKMQTESTMKYDMDDFNCTDYALSVFNAAAPTYLSIPRMHIPNGTFGTTSNTPQGLYIELSNLSKAGGYPGGQISIPNTAPKAGASHGACN